jgi:copper chaperone CopZ
MKSSHLGLALLLVAGAALGTLAVRAKEPTYVVPVRPEDIPLRIEGELPPGHVVRAFEVEGICCTGCGGKLQHALAGIEGVRAIAVDPLRHEVQVLARAEVEPARLAGAMTFDKYVARVR